MTSPLEPTEPTVVADEETQLAATEPIQRDAQVLAAPLPGTPWHESRTVLRGIMYGSGALAVYAVLEIIDQARR